MSRQPMAVCTVRGRPSAAGDPSNMAVDPFLLASPGWHRSRSMCISLWYEHMRLPDKERIVSLLDFC